MYRLNFLDDNGEVVCYYSSSNRLELSSYAKNFKCKSEIKKEENHEHGRRTRELTSRSS